jgi:hypothetical protein
LKRLLSVVFFRQRQAVLEGVGILLSVTAAAVCLLWPALGAGMAGAIGSYPPVAWGRLGCLAVFVTVLGFLWDCEGIRATSVTTAQCLDHFRAGLRDPDGLCDFTRTRHPPTPS